MIGINVEVNFKSWNKKIKNPKKYLTKKLKKISENISFFKRKNIVFTILLTNSSNMKKLNKKFRNRNKSTDVLSFQSNDKIYIGDIAISYEIINKRSKYSNFSIEFDKMWIHGYLHLLGYDHKKKKDFEKMKKIEDFILNNLYKKIDK